MAYEAELSVMVETGEELAKLVEVLSRAQAGLALEGHDTKLLVHEVTCTCGGDCGEDEEDDPSYTE